jgi:phenylacetate-coenzyme A ligase PaaK-like adenylate-forming protein
VKKWYFYGQFRESEEITPQIIEEIIAEGEKKRESIRSLPIPRILNVLDRTGKILADENHPIHNEILSQMPGVINFSEEMVKAGLELLGDILSYDSLKRRIEADMGDAGYLDYFTYNPHFKGSMKAIPRGVTAHVSAGNVFVGAVDTLVQGIVSKNVNILKMSSVDPVFPNLFAEAILEADDEGTIAQSFAIVPFRGGDKNIENIVKQKCNTVVVYGGETAVRAYIDGKGIHTKLVEFGPKYSCMIMDGELLDAGNIETVAENAAKDFSMWEQSACSSPHTIFIKGREKAEEFSRIMAQKLEYYAEIIPPGNIELNEGIEITKQRELAKVWQALDNARMYLPENHSNDWTLIYEKEPKFRVSCHHRTGFICPVESFGEAIDILRPYGEYIQSIGTLAEYNDMIDISNKLTAAGADRITEIGGMSARKHGTPHDGTRGLAELIRWVSVGSDAEFHDEFDYLADDIRDRTTLEKINHIIDHAKRYSEYYSDKLPEKHLTSLEQLHDIPVLPSNVFRDHLPPYGSGILTGDTVNTYAFGSGGTSGKPKFVYRTVDETLRNARALGKGLALSVAKPGDIIANLLYAGNFWASFVSYNQALERTGCMILPIAGNVADLETIVNYLRVFNANGVLTIPSVVLALAQHFEQKNIRDIKIEKVITGGEHLFPQAKRYISKQLGTRKFASVGYTSNDTGAIGFQCERCEGGVHHIHEDMHYVEILDPETNKPVPDGETGKIVVTNLDRTLMPMIRYDIGDMGRIFTEKCECGRQVRLMELLQRSDDVLIIGGANIAADSIAKIISMVNGLSYNFRIIAEEEKMLDKLIVDVETTEKISAEDKQLKADQLYTYLIKEKVELRTFLDKESIARPQINVLDPGDLPRNPRTGKIKQVIDNRISG